MENAVKRRNTLFAKMQWEHAAAKSIRQRQPHPSEVTERLERLRDTRAAFEDVQSELELAADTLEPMEAIFNHRTEFEHIYYAVKTIYVTYLDDTRDHGSDDTIASLPDDFRQAIKSLVETQERFLKAQTTVSTNIGELAAQQQRTQAENPSAAPAHPNANLRLPVFSVPVFRGDRKEWRTFKDLFETGIHNREDISDVLKLQYLLSYLDGEARSLVSAFPISDANYEPAWAKLNEHYDKKKYIVYSLIREFCDQPAVTNPLTGLHKLLATSDDIVRQLSALGEEYEDRDPWLIHLILEKLDKESRSLWAQHVIGDDNPSFEVFLRFLQDRCDALETFSAFTKKPGRTDETKKDVKKEPTRTTVTKEKVFQSFQASAQQCPVCGVKDHSIYKCEMFRGMDVSSRREFVSKSRLCFNCLKGVHAARNCPSTNVCKGSNCKQRHHTLLCQNNQKQQTATANPAAEKPVSTTQLQDSSTNEVVACSGGLAANSKRFPASSITILPTALVKIRGQHGLLHEARVLIDSGSQVSLITQEFAARLGIPRKNARLVVTGLSQLAAGTTKGVVHLFISSRFSDSVVLSTDAYILGRLTAPLPRLQLDEAQLRNLQKLNLADPVYNKASPIDVILGADVFLSVLRDGQIRDQFNRPVAQNSVFGWIISGKHNDSDDNDAAFSLCSEIDIDKTLRMFWESEELQKAKQFTPEEQLVMEHFEKTYSRDGSGRFIVRLPFNNKKHEIGEIYTAAVRRLHAMERRFKTDPEFEERYKAFMKDYASLGHMERIPDSEVDVGSNCYYLPHHAVTKEDSLTTKLRVVFDGSCPSTTGISLNQTLYVGPNINPDLLVVLSRFRTYSVVFVADVTKMYRQVMVDRRDIDYQRIVWRTNANDPIEHYRLLTVTYGTGCAAYLAIEALVHAARSYSSIYPSAAEHIIEDRYVDDLMSGADSLEEACTLRKQIVQILDAAGFPLRKWATNQPALLEDVSEAQTEAVPLQLNGERSVVKALGVQWLPYEDVFIFKVCLPEEVGVTKRQLLSESSRLFDPFGWLSPVIIKAKICYQQTWLYDLHFDDPLPEAVLQEWLDLRNNLNQLEQVRIPRWIPNHNGHIQLLGFCDASETAYAAVVYARSIDGEGEVHVQLFAAKTKLAPVKQVTLPRLELNAAVLLTDLMQKLSLSLGHLQVEYRAWTDSTIVLQWLSALPRRWKTYVANRTSAIQEFMPRNRWNYVPSKENPADCASRGMSPTELVNYSLWWRGPAWLCEDESAWSSSNPGLVADEDLLEERTKGFSAFLTSAERPGTTFEIESAILQRSSKLSSAVRVLAQVKRAVKPRRSRPNGFLTVDELRSADSAMIRLAQRDEFGNEIQRLNQGKEVSRKSRLRQLFPFVDGDGILRVGGRLQNSPISYDRKHPIILPKTHRYTRLLAEQIHVENLHCGPSLLIATLNQRFWILGCSTVTRQVVKDCVTCVRLKGQTASQLMGNLPAIRTTPTRAFTHVGVDYAGPVLVKSSHLRGSRTTKGYISVFICLSTKSVHLEAAGDLSTNSFLMALKRFVGRRGLCLELWSDNGTNFIGASNQLQASTDIEANEDLKEVYALVQSMPHYEAVVQFLANKGIKWQFITPSSPHKGGIWEAAVKSAKKHLRAVIGKEPLTFEELTTVLVQTEACLNSRPLCAISADPGCVEPLTPGHFLIGQPLNLIPEPGIKHLPVNRLDMYQRLQRYTDEIWRRWQDEYLATLQSRHKWSGTQPNLKVGQLVTIKNENLPPSQWEMARISEVHPDKEGRVRTVTLRRGQTELQRSVNKICPLLDN